MRTCSERGSIDAAPAKRAEICGYGSCTCACAAGDTVTVSGGRTASPTITVGAVCAVVRTEAARCASAMMCVGAS